MNTEDFDKQGETIWAYLHGELDKDTRQAFQAELDSDDLLRGRFETARRLDSAIRFALPGQAGSDKADENLDEQALNAWERDQTASTSDKASPRKRDLSYWIRFSLRATAGIASLAAALYVLISPTLRYSPVPRWAPPVFVPLTLRGGETRDETTAVASFTAERCQVALSAALGQALKLRSVILPTGMKFSLTVRELRQGAIAVTVQARTCDGRTVGDWTGDYSDVDAFMSQVNGSAAKMVELLLDKVGTRVKEDAQ